MPAALACAACATLAGAKNPAERAEIVAGFDQRHLRALRCFRNPRTGRYEAPSETTLRRVLGGIDPEAFDPVVAQWVRQQETPAAIALDGKAVKGSLDAEGRPLFLVRAVGPGDAAPCGQVQVESKTNDSSRPPTPASDSSVIAISNPQNVSPDFGATVGTLKKGVKKACVSVDGAIQGRLSIFGFGLRAGVLLLRTVL